MEVRSVRLQDLNFEDEQLKVVHRMEKRPLCVAIKHLIRLLTVYSNAKSQNSTSSTVNHRI
jgi:hypothetical protein